MLSGSTKIACADAHPEQLASSTRCSLPFDRANQQVGKVCSGNERDYKGQQQHNNMLLALAWKVSGGCALVDSTTTFMSGNGTDTLPRRW
jgi:hypothetical protein